MSLQNIYSLYLPLSGLSRTFNRDRFFLSEQKYKSVEDRLWFYENPDKFISLNEVEFEINQNVTSNRIGIDTSDNSLIIRELLDKDIGIYRCRRKEEKNRDVNYKLESIKSMR